VVKSLPTERYQALCEVVTNSVAFQSGFGGSAHHHAYPGGLQDHTMEVIKHCQGMMGSDVDREVLLTAAVWHDFHKIYEYKWNLETDKIDKLPYAKTVGHVVGSAAEFMQVAGIMGFAPDVRQAIFHCILSHHGRREWGSPVEPQTKEAYILHAADMLSAKGN
jgi:3'-5' exoribonuclease